MKIITNNKGFVDFEAPIYMNDFQKDEFLRGMREIFEEINVKQIKEKLKEMDEIERHPKKWTINELALLVEGKSNEEIAEITNRTPFGVQIKRGSWLLHIQSWAKKKGKSNITEDDIKEFEKGDSND